MGTLPISMLKKWWKQYKRKLNKNKHAAVDHKEDLNMNWWISYSMKLKYANTM